MTRNTTAARAEKALRQDLGYVTEEGVCALLGVREEQLQVRRSQGSAPPHYKVGRRNLYKRDELEAAHEAARGCHRRPALRGHVRPPPRP